MTTDRNNLDVSRLPEPDSGAGSAAGDARDAAFAGKAELHALLDELALADRAAPGVSLESRVFAASIEAIANAVPSDVRTLATAIDAAAREDVPVGLTDRVTSASLAALTAHAGIAVGAASHGGAASRPNEVRSAARTNRAHPERRWAIWTRLGGASFLLRVAAALAIVTAAAALYVGVQSSRDNSSNASGSSGTVVANGTATDAAALASEVDRSIDALWDELEVASENDWSESYDLGALEQDLLAREDAS